MFFHSHGGGHGLWNGLLQHYDNTGRDDKSGIHPCAWRTSDHGSNCICRGIFICGENCKTNSFSVCWSAKYPSDFADCTDLISDRAFMCPIMSFFASVLFGFKGTDMLLGNWLQTAARNLPMALFWQLFYAGPFVRFVFRKIYKFTEKRKKNEDYKDAIC